MRYGEGAAKIEGKDLARFMTVLDEYLGFFEKLDKRVRNERVTELVPKFDLAKRADFEGDKKTPPKKIERLEKELKKLQKEEGFKSVEARFDEEHNLWEVSFVNKHGAEHVINWVLASSAECRQLISKYKQIEPYMEPPFVVETLAKAASTNGNGEGGDGEVANADGDETDKKTVKPAKRKTEVEVVEKTNVRDLRDYVINEGRKDFTIQRYRRVPAPWAPVPAPPRVGAGLAGADPSPLWGVERAAFSERAGWNLALSRLWRFARMGGPSLGDPHLGALWALAVNRNTDMW